MHERPDRDEIVFECDTERRLRKNRANPFRERGDGEGTDGTSGGPFRPPMHIGQRRRRPDRNAELRTPLFQNPSQLLSLQIDVRAYPVRHRLEKHGP